MSVNAALFAVTGVQVAPPFWVCHSDFVGGDGGESGVPMIANNRDSSNALTVNCRIILPDGGEKLTQ